MGSYFRSVVVYCHSARKSLRENLKAIHVGRHTDILVVPGADMPQFRGGNPYFLSKNLYQSVSVTNASMYLRHFARDSHRDAVCTKIPILRNKK